MIRDTKITKHQNDPYTHIYTSNFIYAHDWLEYLEEHPSHGSYDDLGDFIVFHIKNEYANNKT